VKQYLVKAKSEFGLIDFARYHSLTFGTVSEFGVVDEHGNDSLFHAAVENDSLIAVLWHFWSFSSFDCL